MMQDDSRDNFLYDSKILWWVDIAVKEILPGTFTAFNSWTILNFIVNVKYQNPSAYFVANIGTIIQHFGLPSDIESCFLNNRMSKDR